MAGNNPNKDTRHTTQSDAHLLISYPMSVAARRLLTFIRCELLQLRDVVCSVSTCFLVVCGFCEGEKKEECEDIAAAPRPILVLRKGWCGNN